MIGQVAKSWQAGSVLQDKSNCHKLSWSTNSRRHSFWKRLPVPSNIYIAAQKARIIFIWLSISPTELMYIHVTLYSPLLRKVGETTVAEKWAYCKCCTASGEQYLPYENLTKLKTHLLAYLFRWPPQKLIRNQNIHRTNSSTLAKWKLFYSQSKAIFSVKICYAHQVWFVIKSWLLNASN